MFNEHRRVNLGGRRQAPQTRDALLQQTAREREARAAAKRAAKAATTLQSHVRRRNAAAAARSAFRASFALPPTPADAAGLWAASRQLNFFCELPRDFAPLAALSAQVAASFRAQSGAGMNALDVIVRSRGARLTFSKLVARCASALACAEALLPARALHTRVVLYVAEALTQRSVLAALIGGDGAAAAAIAADMCKRVVALGLFRSLATFFGSGGGAAAAEVHVAASALALLSAPAAAVAGTEFCADVAAAFVADFACAMRTSDDARLREAVTASFAAFLADPRAFADGLPRLTDSQAILLAENAMPLLSSQTVRFESGRLWGFIFRRLCELLQRGSSSADPTAMAHLLSPSLVRSLVAALIDSASSPSAGSHDVQGLVNALLFFDAALLCKKLDATHAALLHALASGTRLVSAVWPIIAKAPAVHEIGLRGARSEATLEIERVLSLWAKCSLHVLATLDDEEFFAQKLFFGFGTLCEIIPLLTDVAWRLYSALAAKERQRPPPASLFAAAAAALSSTQQAQEDSLTTDLRRALTALLHQFYDRNSRRPFCSTSAWVVKEVSRQSIQASPGDPLSSVVLRSVPFILSFADRIEIFHEALRDDRAIRPPAFMQAHHVTIRRNFFVDDALASLNGLGPALKGNIRVSYIDSDGMPEAGIDGGGLFKDMMTQLMRRLFDPQYALFRVTADHRAYPSPSTVLLTDAERLQQFQFAGRMLGKCLYEELLVELPLAKFFLTKILGKEGYSSPLNDLVFLDPVLYKHLRSLKEQDVTDLDLTFTLVDNDLGESRVVELVPGGRDIAVTNENKQQYIMLVATHHVDTQIRLQTNAFVLGLADLIDTQLLRLFCQDELQFLISGSPSGIDVSDWRANTAYAGGYSDRHPVIEWFWDTVRAMTDEQRAQLLSFVTSCSRPPLQGFHHLNPPFSIQRSSESDHLPSASTCMNLLKLPSAESKEALRTRLLYAIQSNSGFYLS